MKPIVTSYASPDFGPRINPFTGEPIFNIEQARDIRTRLGEQPVPLDPYSHNIVSRRKMARRAERPWDGQEWQFKYDPAYGYYPTFPGKVNYRGPRFNKITDAPTVLSLRIANGLPTAEIERRLRAIKAPRWVVPVAYPPGGKKPEKGETKYLESDDRSIAMHVWHEATETTFRIDNAAYNKVAQRINNYRGQRPWRDVDQFNEVLADQYAKHYLGYREGYSEDVRRTFVVKETDDGGLSVTHAPVEVVRAVIAVADFVADAERDRLIRVFAQKFGLNGVRECALPDSLPDIVGYGIRLDRFDSYPWEKRPQDVIDEEFTDACECGLDAIPDEFVIHPDGIHFRDNPSGDPICGLIYPYAKVRTADGSGSATGLKVITRDGVRAECIIDDAALHDARTCAQALSDRGIYVSTDARDREAVMRFLNRSEPFRVHTRVNKPGPQGDGVFVTPMGEVIGAPGGRRAQHILVGMPPTFDKELGGTIEGQQEALSLALNGACDHIGAVGLLGAAGPVLDALGLPNHGVHLVGATSSGKSTAQKLQASMWSNPKLTRGLRIAGRATDNGLESGLRWGNGTTIAVDDLANGGEGLAQKVAFLFGEGSGKARMTASGDARKVQTGEGMTFSVSSELSRAQLMASAGKGAIEVAGAEARCPIIDAGAFPPMPPEAYKKLAALIDANYGHLGPALVRALAGVGPEAVRTLFDAALSGLTSWPDGKAMTPAQARCAVVFAAMITTGQVMQACGLLGAAVDVAGVVGRVWQVVTASDEFGRLSVGQNAADRLIEFLSTSGDVIDLGVPPMPGRTPLAYRDAPEVIGRRERCWYVPVASLDKISGLGTTPKAAVDELKARGLLVPDGHKWVHQRVPSGLGKVKHYRVRIEE